MYCRFLKKQEDFFQFLRRNYFKHLYLFLNIPSFLDVIDNHFLHFTSDLNSSIQSNFKIS